MARASYYGLHAMNFTLWTRIMNSHYELCMKILQFIMRVIRKLSALQQLPLYTRRCVCSCWAYSERFCAVECQAVCRSEKEEYLVKLNLVIHTARALGPYPYLFVRWATEQICCRIHQFVRSSRRYFHRRILQEASTRDCCQRFSTGDFHRKYFNKSLPQEASIRDISSSEGNSGELRFALRDF